MPCSQFFLGGAHVSVSIGYLKLGPSPSIKIYIYNTPSTSKGCPMETCEWGRVVYWSPRRDDHGICFFILYQYRMIYIYKTKHLV